MTAALIIFICGIAAALLYGAARLGDQAAPGPPFPPGAPEITPVRLRATRPLGH